jgi:hypothetical protein
MYSRICNSSTVVLIRIVIMLLWEVKNVLILTRIQEYSTKAGHHTEKGTETS